MTNKLFEFYKVYSKKEIPQGSEEWHKLRHLKFTASKASIIATNGKGLDTLIKNLLAEHFSSGEFAERTDNYKSPAMQRGNEYESMARMVYEFETGNKVDEVGFIERSKYIGVSPDGLIGVDGLLEIKNHSDSVFLELILTEKIDSKYIAQMQYQLWVTGRKWCDYFGYNPNFKPSFYLHRFYPDEEMFAKFEAGVTAGSAMLDNRFKMLAGKLKEPEQTEIETKISNAKKE